MRLETVSRPRRRDRDHIPAASIQLLRQTSTSCIAGISDWMKSNRLQLNSSKTDFLWCSSSRRRKQLDQTPFIIGIVAVELCLLVYKCLHHMAPKYLSVHIIPLSNDPARQRLRSSKTLDVQAPASKHATLGGRAFCVAGPKAWNSLPDTVQRPESISSFKKLLKTHLFHESYDITD